MITQDFKFNSMKWFPICNKVVSTCRGKDHCGH